MTKYIEEAKVVGQRILNATTKQIDLIAPRIAAEAVPGGSGCLPPRRGQGERQGMWCR